MCLVTQACLTLCNPTDCSTPGSSVHGILQARILEWVAMPSSRGSSQPRDRTHVSELRVDSLPTEPPGKTKTIIVNIKMPHRDFPGGPVVSTLCFHCRGHGFDPCLGNLRSCKLHGTAKKGMPSKISVKCQRNCRHLQGSNLKKFSTHTSARWNFIILLICTFLF